MQSLGDFGKVDPSNTFSNTSEENLQSGRHLIACD